MRQRTVAINIRVTEAEKRKMQSVAKKCGLSLSAYLRKLALGKEVKAISSPVFYEAYKVLSFLREHWKNIPDENICQYIDEIIRKLLQAYHETESDSKE